MKPHLISTSAHINNSERIQEYIDGYSIIHNYKNFFNTITIIETISKKKLDYLEKTNLNVVYSNVENIFTNKGVNWLNHVYNFLETSTIGDKEIVIFITGRYKMINTNILNFISIYMIDNDFEFLAKEDGDLYEGLIHGVHTFFMSFTKRKFLEFYDWYKTNGNINECIEWDVKKFLLTSNKCKILPKTEIMGVETRVFNSTLNKIC